ncbi:MAG: gliding motility-associated C-terminal domain-containing protein [Flavobacteriales bacterium]
MGTTAVVIVLLLGVLDVRAQPQVVDSCFTSVPPGTSFPESSSLSSTEADDLEWTGSDWIGDWPGASLVLPPPTGLIGCHSIFMGSGSVWTTGGEGFGMLLSEPLVAGQTYSFTFTYVSHGMGSDGNFSPEFSTGSSSNYGSSTPIGFLPPAGFTWATNTFTFTATAAQDGDTWIFLHSTPSGSSGMVNSLCLACNVPPTTCTVDLGPDQTLCPGAATTLDATTAGATYVWQDASTAAQLNVNTAGTYWVQMTANGCTATDTVVVDFLTVSSIDLGNDTVLCTGSTLLLDATTAGSTYQWQDNSSAPTFLVDVPGFYSVNVTVGACSVGDAIVVAFDPVPVVDLGPDVTLCTGSLLMLDASYPGATYVWQDASTAATYDASAGGTFSVTLTLGTCTASDAIDVAIATPPDAGTDGSITLCSSEGIADLFGQLAGTPGVGGTWTAPGGGPFSGNFDPATDTPGDYVYTISGVAPCPSDDASVTVDVIAVPDPGNDASLSLCSSGNAPVLFDNLGGTPDVGGTWSDPLGNAFAGTFDPAVDPAGDYTYAFFPPAPCAAVSAVISMSVIQALDAGTDGSVEFCQNGAAADLFSSLGGTPDAGGTWSAPAGGPFSGVFNPTVNAVGDYTYTVNPGVPCSPSSAVVAVTIPPAADAGPDAGLCDLDHDLNALGTWTSGSWSGPVGISFGDATVGSTTVTSVNGGAYLLTWTTISASGCVSSDDVQITFAEPIVPAIAVTGPTCNGLCDATASASASGGNPAPGGYDYAWSGGIGGNTPNIIDLCAGSYSVTVTDANGCSTDQPFAIDAPAPLVIDTIITSDETCPGTCDGTVTINDMQAVAFSIDAGATFQTGNVFAALCAAGFPVMIEDAAGCHGEGIAQINSPPPVEAAFVIVPETLFVDQTAAQFVNTSAPNVVALTWDFGGLGSSTDRDPTFMFPLNEPDMYTICLAASDANGCADTTCIDLVVLDRPVLHVPNAFTPDGDDINEGFAPVINVPYVVDYEFLVFDRWGEVIFSSTEPGEAWDGQYGGALVQTGIYPWKLTWRDQFRAETTEALGHVTVLR